MDRDGALWLFAGVSSSRAVVLLAKLTAAGLLHAVEGGWQVHDYEHYQGDDAAAAIEARRSADRERQRKRRTASRDCHVTDCDTSRDAVTPPIREDREIDREGMGPAAHEAQAPPPSQPPAKPRKRPAAIGHRLPPDWTPSDDLLATIAASETIRLRRADALAQVEAFRDHWAAKAGRDGAKLDWNAAFRTWCRKQRQWHPELPVPGANGAGDSTARGRNLLPRGEPEGIPCPPGLTLRLAEGPP